MENRAYLDIDLMLGRIRAKNIFVTRIKSNTLYKSVEELDLPEDEDQDILKEEIIKLNSQKAAESTINQQKLRWITVYKEDENKTIQIITNNLDWKARTVAD